MNPELKEFNNNKLETTPEETLSEDIWSDIERGFNDDWALSSREIRPLVEKNKQELREYKDDYHQKRLDAWRSTYWAFSDVIKSTPEFKEAFRMFAEIMTWQQIKTVQYRANSQEWKTVSVDWVFWPWTYTSERKAIIESKTENWYEYFDEFKENQHILLDGNNSPSWAFSEFRFEELIPLNVEKTINKTLRKLDWKLQTNDIVILSNDFSSYRIERDWEIIHNVNLLKDIKEHHPLKRLKSEDIKLIEAELKEKNPKYDDFDLFLALYNKDKEILKSEVDKILKEWVSPEKLKWMDLDTISDTYDLIESPRDQEKFSRDLLQTIREMWNEGKEIAFNMFLEKVTDPDWLYEYYIVNFNDKKHIARLFTATDLIPDNQKHLIKVWNDWQSKRFRRVQYNSWREDYITWNKKTGFARLYVNDWTTLFLSERDKRNETIYNWAQMDFLRNESNREFIDHLFDWETILERANQMALMWSETKFKNDVQWARELANWEVVRDWGKWYCQITSHPFKDMMYPQNPSDIDYSLINKSERPARYWDKTWRLQDYIPIFEDIFNSRWLELISKMESEVNKIALKELYNTINNKYISEDIKIAIFSRQINILYEEFKNSDLESLDPYLNILISRAYFSNMYVHGEEKIEDGSAWRDELALKNIVATEKYFLRMGSGYLNRIAKTLWIDYKFNRSSITELFAGLKEDARNKNPSEEIKSFLAHLDYNADTWVMKWRWIETRYIHAGKTMLTRFAMLQASNSEELLWIKQVWSKKTK